MDKPTDHHMPAHRAESQRATAVSLLGEHGIMRLSELKAAGVPYQTLTRMAQDGTVLRVGRGLYQLPEAKYAWAHSLAEEAKAVPKGVICLISALQFHEPTLPAPLRVCASIGRKGRMPRISYPVWDTRLT